MLFFAIIFNLLTGSICDTVDFAKMVPNLFFCSKATIECFNKAHGVDKIEIKWGDLGTMPLGNLNVLCPFFDGGSNSTLGKKSLGKA